MIELGFLKEYPHYSQQCAQWAFHEWYNDRKIDSGIVLLDYMNRSKKESPICTIIAHEKNRLLGMVSLKESVLKSLLDCGPWLVSLYVHSDFRFQGIGSKLVKRLIEVAGKDEHKELYLFLAQSEKEKLGAFYAKLGWEFYLESLDNDNVITSVYRYIY